MFLFCTEAPIHSQEILHFSFLLIVLNLLPKAPKVSLKYCEDLDFRYSTVTISGLKYLEAIFQKQNNSVWCHFSNVFVNFSLSVAVITFQTE